MQASVYESNKYEVNKGIAKVCLPMMYPLRHSSRPELETNFRTARSPSAKQTAEDVDSAAAFADKQQEDMSHKYFAASTRIRDPVLLPGRVDQRALATDEPAILSSVRQRATASGKEVCAASSRFYMSGESAAPSSFCLGQQRYNDKLAVSASPVKSKQSILSHGAQQFMVCNIFCNLIG